MEMSGKSEPYLVMRGTFITSLRKDAGGRLFISSPCEGRTGVKHVKITDFSKPTRAGEKGSFPFEQIASVIFTDLSDITGGGRNNSDQNGGGNPGFLKKENSLIDGHSIEKNRCCANPYWPVG